MKTKDELSPNDMRWQACYELRKAMKDLARVQRKAKRVANLLKQAGLRGDDMLPCTVQELVPPVVRMFQLAEQSIEVELPF